MSIKTHYAIKQANETDVAFSNGTITPVNSAGPSAVHFYPCNEGSGTTLTDILGANNLATATNSWTALTHVGADSSEVTAGTYEDFGTDNFAAFCTFEIDSVADSVALGGTQAADLSILFAAGTALGSVAVTLDDNVTPIEMTLSTLTVSSGTTISAGVVVDRAGNATLWATDGTTTDTATADATGLASFQPNAEMTQNAKLYGIAAWHFTGALPSDYAAAFSQMRTDWLAGRKILYQGWIDQV